MKEISGFLLKVIVGSTLISFAIKYVGPSLPIAANSFNALIIALLPSILLAIALAWHRTNSKTS